ncbi:c-type cytochrome [Methylobacter sp.]|uniref:c-type cytochrome n=1 Tax=Methylobacter sp. TaxID=2051955 RepID=UPI002FDED24F
MRSIILSLIAVVFFTTGSAVYSQELQPQNPSEPTPKQLLQTEVGQTHIPVQAKSATYANPYANDNQAIVEGRKLFNSMNCSGCHAPLGGGGMGPPLSDDEWVYGDRPEQIYLTILQGRPNGMPAFGSALPEESIWKLAAYIKTLSALPAPSNPPAQPKSSD